MDAVATCAQPNLDLFEAARDGSPAAADFFLDPRLDMGYLDSFDKKLSSNASCQLLFDPTEWPEPVFDDSPITFGEQPAINVGEEGPVVADFGVQFAEALSGEDVLTAASWETRTDSTHPPSAEASSTSSPRVSRTSSKSSVPTIESIRSSPKSPTPPKSPERKRQKRVKQPRATVHEEDDENEEGGKPASGRHKFLERNRMAASKCRQKKKEWIQDLEQTKSRLEERHMSLQKEYIELLAEASLMKNHLMAHAGCNDSNIDLWIETQAKKFVQDTVNPPSGPSPANLLGPNQDSASALSPTMELMTTQPSSPEIKLEPINYDHMPDDMFDD